MVGDSLVKNLTWQGFDVRTFRGATAEILYNEVFISTISFIDLSIYDVRTLIFCHIAQTDTWHNGDTLIPSSH